MDAVLLASFRTGLSLLTPRQFAEDILRNRLHAREVHEGYNFHFGHKAAGNVDTLAEFGGEMGFAVKIYDEMKLRGERVSSSQIRKLLECWPGEPGAALAGTAVRDSVHAGPRPRLWLEIHRTYHQFEPLRRTDPKRWRLHHVHPRWQRKFRFGDKRWQSSDVWRGFIRDESHLLNFHPLELTPETEVEIHFLSRVRDEIKFASVEALREQIGKDVKKARRYFRLRHGG